jgi:RNA polymerase sigma-70 factor (ECF subfamily)
VSTKHSHYNDKELLSLIAKSDRKAFAELFNRYWQKTYDTAYAKTGDSEVAEEIGQDIFTVLWDKRATLLIRNIDSYLYISVKNRCINFIASKIVERKHAGEYRHVIAGIANRADEELGYNDLLEQINAGMEGLPEKTQQIFLLNRLEGRSVSEIANVLNLSEKAIEYHLTRSLKQLRTYLKDY